MAESIVVIAVIVLLPCHDVLNTHPRVCDMDEKDPVVVSTVLKLIVLLLFLEIFTVHCPSMSLLHRRCLE